MAIDLINDMCKVLCMYMYLTRCKTEMKKKHTTISYKCKSHYEIEYFQYDILEESLNALEKLCKSNLCKMKSLFPQNRPSDGLGNEKS